MANFVFKNNFGYHGNKGQSEVNFIHTVQMHDLEKPMLGAIFFGYISHISRVIAYFVLKFTNFRYHGNKSRCGVNFNDTVKFRQFENPLFSLRILAILDRLAAAISRRKPP